MCVSSQVVNLLDRHLLREWLKIFVLVLVATMGLLLLQAMREDLADLLEQHASLADTIVYFAVRLPGGLSMVLPLAMLLSLLYTLGRLHRNGEITALRAAGLGLLQITRVVWLVGGLLCGLVWWLNASVVPWSVEESRAIRQNLRFSRDAAQAEEADAVGVRASVAFDNQRAGRMWFFNRYSQFTGRGFGVTVVVLDTQHRETTRLLAREARPDPAGGWSFRDGREIWLDPESGVVTRTQEFAEKREAYFNEDPALMLVFDQKPSDLSFNELGRIIDYFAVENNPKVTAYAVRYYGLLADAMVPLIVIMLAVPFALTGVRVNPAVGVSKSIGFFLLYYALVKICYACGARDLLPPLWAALAPNFAMLGVGGALFARAR